MGLLSSGALCTSAFNGGFKTPVVMVASTIPIIRGLASGACECLCARRRAQKMPGQGATTGKKSTMGPSKGSAFGAARAKHTGQGLTSPVNMK